MTSFYDITNHKNKTIFLLKSSPSRKKALLMNLNQNKVGYFFLTVRKSSALVFSSLLYFNISVCAYILITWFVTSILECSFLASINWNYFSMNYFTHSKHSYLPCLFHSWNSGYFLLHVLQFIGNFIVFYSSILLKQASW